MYYIIYYKASHVLYCMTSLHRNDELHTSECGDGYHFVHNLGPHDYFEGHAFASSYLNNCVLIPLPHREKEKKKNKCPYIVPA